MPWTPLAGRLNDLPLMLAGPILREVTPEFVTVWVALRKHAEVELVVIDPVGDKPLSGKRPTVAIGTNLHIVAVTAKRQPPFAPLKEGIVYRYEMTFAFDGGPPQSLTVVAPNASLAYPPFTSPSFCLPPADVNSLRLIHGSCRIPHGNSIDALPMLDELIEQTASNALSRPHQLLMTGDQIYADDVAVSLLIMLTDAGAALLDWKELLPFPTKHGGLKTPEQKLAVRAAEAACRYRPDIGRSRRPPAVARRVSVHVSLRLVRRALEGRGAAALRRGGGRGLTADAATFAAFEKIAKKEGDEHPVRDRHAACVPRPPEAGTPGARQHPELHDVRRP